MIPGKCKHKAVYRIKCDKQRFNGLMDNIILSSLIEFRPIIFGKIETMTPPYRRILDQFVNTDKKQLCKA